MGDEPPRSSKAEIIRELAEENRELYKMLASNGRYKPAPSIS